MSLSYNFSAGELVRRSLNSLPPGVYCISLSSTEGKVIRTFSFFETGSLGR